MAGVFVPLVLIPRYTTYAGAATDFITIGMDVTDYESATVSFWRGPFVGTGVAITINFEESMDQLTWTVCTGGPYLDPGAAIEGQFIPLISKRWFRIRVTVAGTNPVVTCWCIGFLEQRET
jgi:hypothetical protein